MAVAIQGHDDFLPEDNSEDFEYLPVAGEYTFAAIWEPAIAQLGITRLANGIYLKREELRDILDDLRRVKEWIEAAPSLDDEGRGSAVSRIEWLISELPERWLKCPDAKTLWMG